ncbi:MAG: PLP-dependent aspartate aminotransferase family protein [bacterium]|nr:PLP-dependent aspartate aminotransferase family protein [bacterium]
MEFETRAIHVGQEPEPATGSVVVPIYQTSTYAQEVAPLAESIGKHKGYEYSRIQNPTRKALEECIASLENCKYGLAFASGMAAINTVMNLLKASDHVISTWDIYGGTYRIFEYIFRQYGLEFSFVDTTDLDNVVKEIRPNTKLIWVETPTNPLLRLVDLEAVAKIGKKYGLITVVDNTFATPYFQTPVDFGIDIVVHSTTKYLGGHSDVIGGAITTNNEKHYKRLKFCQGTVGGVPGAFDSWLVLRGLKTLAVRMKAHFNNAMKVAEFLNSHPKVKKVYFPYLKSAKGATSHPQYKLAKKQMRGMSGMVSFEISGGLDEVKSFLKRIKVFTLAESLGGVESLVEHPSTMSHAVIPVEKRIQMGITDTLLRLSVGIENINDLINDLRTALK